MTLLIYGLAVIAGLFLGAGLYHLADFAFVFPSGSAKAKLKNLYGKPGIREKLRRAVVEPMTTSLEKVMRPSAYKRKQMKSRLERLKISKTPERHMAETAAVSVLLATLSLLFIPAGLPMMPILALALAVMLFFKRTQDIQTQLDKQNRQIEDELPRMVETLNLTLDGSYDLLSFFERYRKVAGTAMGKELDTLIFELKTGNTETALRNMEGRLAIPQVSAFVSVLLGVVRGIDQKTTLMIMERDLRTRQRELLRKEADRRPGRIRLASIVLTLLMVLLMMVPLFVMIINTFTGVGL